MSRFAIRYPYFIVVCCLLAAVLGGASLLRMPVDLFPSINIPVVVAATFYQGMPPEQIEMDITSRMERMFTLAGNIDHLESRSLPGVSIIRAYFQPGSNPDSALTSISNLAMAELGKLPKGTLPPVILKFDASNMPVCLVTFKGKGLGEKELVDIARYNVRNQIASVPGASVPMPFGGKARQIQVYIDPLKLQAYDMSIMDVVKQVNQNNLILPSGYARLGERTYNLYTNSQLETMQQIDRVPLRTNGQSTVLVGDIGHAEDANAIQTNLVRVDGQASVYVPVLKQGGNTNAISVVNGTREVVEHLLDVPKTLVTNIVFDQSQFIKSAIENLGHEGLIGLFLTSVMILIFLGSARATAAVMLSIPLSALTTFCILPFFGGTINSMTLGGLALAFSRLIDNSVIVLENIFRHLEMGELPEAAAERGGREVAMPVLAATLTTSIVFLPVAFLYGVSQFLFSALGLTVVLSLVASYVVAMTVVPLFCARYIKHAGTSDEASAQKSFASRFNRGFNAFLDRYQSLLGPMLRRPKTTVGVILAMFFGALALSPWLETSFFPRTDPGQFTIRVMAPPGLRLERTNQEIARVEQLVRDTVHKEDLQLIVSNIGTQVDIPAIYSSNSTENTAFVQVGLTHDHEVGSYEYIRRMRAKLAEEMPELQTFLQAGGLVDSVVNMGMPAPIDVQVSSRNMEHMAEVTTELASKIRKLPGIGGIYTPQSIDQPALKIDVDRVRAAQVGLSQREVVDNVISALTSNAMIAPSFWVDPKTGQDYYLTTQYPLERVNTLTDLKNLMLRGPDAPAPTPLESVASIHRMQSPNEVDHYQIRRIMDIYVSPQGEDLGRLSAQIQDVIDSTSRPEGVTVTVRGLVEAMHASFESFGVGLVLSIVLVYLVLVAQFQSFIDPLIILLAVPTGIAGAILILLGAGSTLNVMSLMGVVMLSGIVVSNSILIVQFANELRSEGMAVGDAVSLACRARPRPVLMTSLATVIGLIPMALKLGTGSEAYAPLAQVIIGGVLVSVVLTVFIVPAAYLLVHDREPARRGERQPA